MNRFDRVALLVMSIAVLVVACANSFINWRQNEMIHDLYEKLYILDAEISTNSAKCTNRYNSLLNNQVDTLEALQKAIKGGSNG